MKIAPYERQLPVAQAPTPQIQPLEPRGDYNAGAANTFQNLAARLQKFQNDVDDTRTLDLFNKFKLDSQEYHENPDNGIYNTRLGYRSAGIYQDADKWLREKGEYYVSQLDSPRAKDNFRKMAAEHIEQRGLQNSRFEAQQIRHYQQNTAQATIDNALLFAGKNWNDKNSVQQARNEAAQAIELLYRDSGVEVMKNAYADFEDKLAITRLQQAYAKDKLLALGLLSDGDIKLKPETFAKLKVAYTQDTEIFRIQAAASEAAKRYTQTNMVQARDDLINMYGTEFGQKVFAALSNTWSVANSQQAARDKAKHDSQQANEERYISRFADPNGKQPTIQEIDNDRVHHKISPQFALSAIDKIKAAAQAQATAQARATQAKSMDVLWEMENNHIYLDDETLRKKVGSGEIAEDDARRHASKRDQYSQQQERLQAQQEQERLQKNKNDLMLAVINREVTPDMIVDAGNRGDIRPEDVLPLRNALFADNERIKRGIAQDEKARQDALKADQERLEKTIRIIVRNGGRVSRDTVNNLYEGNRISESFANELWGNIDKYEAAQDKLRRDEATAQAKAQQEALKDELDNRAKSIAQQYGAEEGKALQYVEGLGLDRTTSDFLKQRVSHYISTTKKVDAENKAKAAEQAKQLQAAHDAAYQDEWLQLMTRKFSSLQEIETVRSQLRTRRGKDLSDTEHRELESVLNSHQKALQEALDVAQQENYRSTAKQLFDQFGLDGQYDARKEIDKLDVASANAVRTHFNRLVQEAENQKRDHDKAIAEQQKQTFNSLHDQYWNNAQPVPDNILTQLKDSKAITHDQWLNALQQNQALITRKGIEDTLSRYTPGWLGMTQEHQEQLILQAMGTDEGKRKQYVANLLSMSVDGTITDEKITWEYNSGHITSADAERLKNFDAQMTKALKTDIRTTSLKLAEEIRNVGRDDPRTRDVVRDANTDFYIATANLEAKDKNSRQALQDIHDSILSNALDKLSSGKNRTQFNLWRFSTELSPWGQREFDARSHLYQVQQSQPDFIYQPLDTELPVVLNTQGNLASFDNSPNITLPETQKYTPPAVGVNPFFFLLTAPLQENTANTGNYNINPAQMAAGVKDIVDNLLVNTSLQDWSTPQPQQPPAPSPQPQQPSSRTQPQNLGMLMVQGGTLTGRFSDPRTYRNGTHNGVDIAAKAGTPITVPDIGVNFSVKSVRNTKAGGNQAVLQGVTPNGDNLELIVSHMQDNSVPFKQGDEVFPGMLIGKVGNTGYTGNSKKGMGYWFEGKDWGYHMDLKIKVNGHYVDPETFQGWNGSRSVPTPQNIAASYTPPDYTPPPYIPPTVSSDEEVYSMIDALFSGGLSPDSSDFGIGGF